MPALVEYVLFFSLVLIGVAGGAWIMAYKALGRRLKERGIGPRPSPSGRVNSMDVFFNTLKFLIGKEDRAVGDGGITWLCVAVKLCTGLMLLGFLTMVFGPFFLTAH